MAQDAIEAFNALARCGVPLAIRTTYEDGKPVKSEIVLSKITKRDRFYRINGKIVSRNMAAWAARAGIAAA